MWERVFFYLSRVNAVGIFVLLCLMAFFFVRDQMRYTEFREESEIEFGRDYDGETDYFGDEITARGGVVLAYQIDSAGNSENDLARKEGSNISLTNMTTGQSRQIAGEGQSIVNWEIVYTSEPERAAIGYTAFVADTEQFRKGKFDLVAGTLPGLQQFTLAEDIRAGDLPTVHGENGLAMVIWPTKDEARFIAFDFDKGEIIERVQVPLPRVSANNLSTGALPAQFWDAPTGGASEDRIFNPYH